MQQSVTGLSGDQKASNCPDYHVNAGLSETFGLLSDSCENGIRSVRLGQRRAHPSKDLPNPNRLGCACMLSALRSLITFLSMMGVCWAQYAPPAFCSGDFDAGCSVVTKTNAVALAPSATTDTTNASNILKNIRLAIPRLYNSRAASRVPTTNTKSKSSICCQPPTALRST